MTWTLHLSPTRSRISRTTTHSEWSGSPSSPGDGTRKLLGNTNVPSSCFRNSHLLFLTYKRIPPIGPPRRPKPRRIPHDLDPSYDDPPHHFRSLDARPGALRRAVRRPPPRPLERPWPLRSVRRHRRRRLQPRRDRGDRRGRLVVGRYQQ